MANENCLEGMMCPKCGQEEKFSIVCSCVAVWEMTDAIIQKMFVMLNLTAIRIAGVSDVISLQKLKIYKK